MGTAWSSSCTLTAKSLFQALVELETAYDDRSGVLTSTNPSQYATFPLPVPFPLNLFPLHLFLCWPTLFYQVHISCLTILPPTCLRLRARACPRISPVHHLWVWGWAVSIYAAWLIVVHSTHVVAAKISCCVHTVRSSLHRWLRRSLQALTIARWIHRRIHSQ